MSYMLDTNICIYILNKKPISYIEKLEALEKNSSLCISSIVLAELQYGVSNSKFKEQNQINVNQLICKLDVLDFSEKCAFYYGELRADLKKKGIIIGNNDLLIASHALAEELTLVTNNASEFNRVKGLKVIDWQ
ncbi:MAG: PIN domain-containing protein [Rickettsiaceae bacterium]